MSAERPRSSPPKSPLAVQPGKPIYDRGRTPVPTQPAGVPQQPRREVVKVIARTERDEFLWLKGHLGQQIKILFNSGIVWEHCQFIRLHTFSLAIKNSSGVECLIFKHGVTALIPEDGRTL